MDLTQFGQWLAGQQENLLKSLWQEQRQAEEFMSVLFMEPPLLSFQSLMDTVLGPHEEYTLAYLDDIIIYSKTWFEIGGEGRESDPFRV